MPVVRKNVAVDHTHPFKFGSDVPQLFGSPSSKEEVLLHSWVVKRPVYAGNRSTAHEELDVLGDFVDA